MEVTGGVSPAPPDISAPSRGLTIDPSLLTAGSKEMLEDLIVAAFNDAKTKADQAGSAEMGKLTAGMQLPPGFKLPDF